MSLLTSGGFMAIGGGLSAYSDTAGKRLLRQRRYGRWKKILHSETTDGGSLSQHIGGGPGGRRRQLWFEEGGFVMRFYILQNGVVLMLKKEKKLIEPFGSTSGLIDRTGPE